MPRRLNRQDYLQQQVVQRRMHPDDHIGRRGPLTLESVMPQRVDTLLGQSYDAKVTRMDRGVFGPQPGGDSTPRTGPIVTANMPFTLVPNAVAIVIASQDPNRKALILQNKDPVANLFYEFGALADTTSTFLTPGMYLLLDFVCPTDRVTVFAVAAVSGSLKTMSPAG
jgi:hypothetical protein